MILWLKSYLGGVGLAVVAFLTLAGLTVGGIYLFGSISKSTANFRGDVGVKNRTLADPDYRIAAYNHFFDLCAAVQTQETRITTTRANLAHDQKGSFDQYRDRQVLDASIAQRSELINQYNADAAKSYTQAQFLASSLPYHLDPNQEHTQCAV